MSLVIDARILFGECNPVSTQSPPLADKRAIRMNGILNLGNLGILSSKSRTRRRILIKETKNADGKAH